MTEEEIISGAEEESDFEEEEDIWPDNTTNREEIINATPQSFEDIEDYINNLEISTPDIDEVNWDDEEQLIDHIPVTLDATKLIYSTKKVL